MIELITVLAILGVMAAVVAAAWPRAEPPTRLGSLAAARVLLIGARRQAIERGRPVTVTGTVAGSQPHADSADSTTQWRATALPDGSIIASPPFLVERLTGRPRDGAERP